MHEIIYSFVSLLILYMLIVKLFHIFTEEGALQYLKDDWSIRLPNRMRYNRYRGLNRICYCILSVLYYLIKDLFIAYFAFAFYFYKFFLWDIWNKLFKIDQREWFQKLREQFSRVEDEEDENEDIACNEYFDDTEELPFCQLFRINKEVSLFIDHVEMCPDETAFIRVVGEESYTPLYKRKVKRNRVGDRFIVFNGTNYYLNDKKTQPIIPKK